MTSFTSFTGTVRMPRRGSSMLAGIVAGVALTGLVSGVLPVASAQAATATCPVTTLSEPFAKWGDKNAYSLVPGGDFETSPSPWTLGGGAKQAAGSDPYALTGKLGAYSLDLPARSTAQSPYVCVEANDRTYRFVARSEGGSTLALVQLVYKLPYGGTFVSPGTFVTMSGTWTPSAIFETGAPLATAILGNTTELSLRFTTFIGTARIDDVFLDPRRR